VREVEPETHAGEFVPLEGDAEAQGKKKPGEAVEGGDEVELDDESLEDENESLEEDALIADDEEEDTDVADILGGDIEKEEET
jgi:hypothetical protein